MNKQTIWLIINPISGGGKKYKKILQLIDDQLDTDIYSPEIKYTEYAGHATEIARQAVEQSVNCVVAIGGDGTVNEIGKALIGTNTALGIIPTGSGNGLARELKIPLSPKLAIQSLNTPIKQIIDVCFINEIPFFCTAGIGFDANCAAIFAKSKGRGLGNYIKAGLSEFWNFKPIKCAFAGQNYAVFSFTFGNASQFGNNAYIAPTAIIDDGLIDCTIIQPPSFFQALRLIQRLFNKTIHHSTLAENYRGTKFLVKNEQNCLIHFDGEPLQLLTNELTISILEKSLNVLT